MRAHRCHGATSARHQRAPAAKICARSEYLGEVSFYDGSGHILTIQATLPSSTLEKTQYVYGATTSGGSDVNSNDILLEVRWPDKTTGNPSTTDKETYTVNALGENKTYTDRNGSVHTYSFDVVGRPTADAVTTLASGVDGAVRRLETAYDTGGRADLFTSYDAATGGNVVNQVQELFNGQRPGPADYRVPGTFRRREHVDLAQGAVRL